MRIGYQKSTNKSRKIPLSFANLPVAFRIFENAKRLNLLVSSGDCSEQKVTHFEKKITQIADYIDQHFDETGNPKPSVIEGGPIR